MSADVTYQGGSRRAFADGCMLYEGHFLSLPASVPQLSQYCLGLRQQTSSIGDLISLTETAAEAGVRLEALDNSGIEVGEVFDCVRF